MSEISKLSAISSKLEDVALAICSSRAVLDANQLAMLSYEAGTWKARSGSLKLQTQYPPLIPGLVKSEI